MVVSRAMMDDQTLAPELRSVGKGLSDDLCETRIERAVNS